MKLQNFLIISFLYINSLQAAIDNKNYEEVVVSASLMPISIGNSANAITIISAEEIESIAIANLSDLLRDVPGFAVSRSGVLGAQTQIRVRGSEANHVLVLIDGIEVNNNAQNDEFNWGNISASDIERIEIIRGPQSSMFGSDALSGVINIITKRAKEDYELNGFTEYGSFNTKNNAEIDPAAHENSGKGKGNNGTAAGYRALAAAIKSIDTVTVQTGASTNTGMSSGAAADVDMHTTSGLLAAQMRAKGEVQAIETMRSSGVSASVSGETPMSSENGFTGGRENGAGGTAGTQTPLAGGRNTALHLDMLTKDWNEKLAQALEQRISGGGKEIDFVLTPKSLGRLRVSMSMIEGQLSLAIKTDTAMAAAMLGDAESQLVQMLEARDLRVASFAASTSGQPGQQNDGTSQGDTSSNGEGRRENEDDIDAVEQVSALTADDDGINVTA